MEFTFQPIKTLQDALSIRLIRNSCRRYMTKDTNKIKVREQLEWWYNYNKNKNYIWCYIAKVNNLPVGYGLVRCIDFDLWISGGLIPEARGKGLGKKIFQGMIDKFINWSLYLEVLESNKVAYKLYKKLGFKEIKKEGNVITMVRKYGR